MSMPPPNPSWSTPGPTASPSARSWPSKAKVAVGLLAVLLIAMAAVSAVLISRAGTETDDARKELSTTQDQLARAKARAASTDDTTPDASTPDVTTTTIAGAPVTVGRPGTDDSAQVAQLQATVTSDEQTIANQKVTLDSQAASISQLNSQLTASQTQAEQAQADAAKATAALATANSNLAAAQSSANAVVTPFDVDVTKIRPPTTNFATVGNKVSCSGFGPEVCVDSRPLVGHFIVDTSGIYFEEPNVVKVQLGTLDGLTYAGQAPVTGDASFNCGGNLSATNFAVSFSPTHFTIGPSDHSALATSFSVTWTESSPAGGGCAASSFSYHGFFNITG